MGYCEAIPLSIAATPNQGCTMSTRKGKLSLGAFLMFIVHHEPFRNDNQATTARQRCDPWRAAGRCAGIHSVAA
jgi:hypothetical protein